MTQQIGKFSSGRFMGAIFLMRDMLYRCLPRRKRTHILIACLPKTGSTFLAETMGALPGLKRFRLTPAWGTREQELCQIRLSRANHLDYIAQHHLRNSEWTQKLLADYGVSTVVLLRNLPDCVVSVCDHLRREPQSSPMAHFTPEQISAMTDDQLQEAVVRFVMPWYINFCMGWLQEPKALFVRYEDVVHNPSAAIAEILKYAQASYTAEGIEAALKKVQEKQMRFNVGIAGRGRSLCATAARELSRMLDFYPEIKNDERLVRPDDFQI